MLVDSNILCTDEKPKHLIDKLLFNLKTTGYVCEEDFCVITTKSEFKLCHELKQAVNAFYCNNISNAKKYNENALYIINENHDTFSYDMLLISEKTFMMLRDYNSAFIVRKLIFSKLLKLSKEDRLSDTYFMPYFWALSESNAGEQLLEHQKSVKKLTDEKLKRDCSAYFNMINNKAIEIGSEIAENEKKFYNLIKGKKIAVLGVCEGKLDTEYIKNNFDFIVSMNYKGDSVQGLKPNLLYYNKSGSMLIKDSGLYKEDSSIAFTCYKYIDSELKEEECTYKNSRKMHMPRKLMINGFPNMIQYIIFDLLHYEPEKIKVFNSNFYTTKSFYSKDYSCNGAFINEVLYNWIARHNIFDQLLFTKLFLQNKSVEFDEIGMNVLNMSLKDYCDLFYSIHSL